MTPGSAARWTGEFSGRVLQCEQPARMEEFRELAAGTEMDPPRTGGRQEEEEEGPREEGGDHGSAHGGGGRG